MALRGVFFKYSMLFVFLFVLCTVVDAGCTVEEVEHSSLLVHENNVCLRNFVHYWLIAAQATTNCFVHENLQGMSYWLEVT